MRLQQLHGTRLAALGNVLLVTVLLLAAVFGTWGVSRTSVEAADSTPNDFVQVRQDAPEEELAATVNGEPITLDAFERERARRMLGLELEPASQDVFDTSVLDAMIDQVLIEQAAVELDITVPEEDIDAELALQEELAAANGTTLDAVIAAQLYTPEEYRAAVQDFLLVQAVSDVVADVPESAPQVHSRHILVADEATARELLTQLQAGVDFAQLATTYSLDVSTADSGGDLGWVTRGVLLQREVEDVIFALQPGQIAANPVQSSLGYHIVQTLERVEDRPLSPAAFAQSKQQAFLNWLDQQRQTAEIVRFVGVQQ